MNDSIFSGWGRPDAMSAIAGSSAAELPVIQITRHMVEAQLRIWRHAHDLFPTHINRSIIFQLIARQSATRWYTGPVDLLASPGLGAMSVHSLAASLHRPFETVRRHVNALIEAGYCVRQGGKVYLAPRPDRIAQIAAYYSDLGEELARLFDELAQIGVFESGRQALEGVPPGVLAAAALDISLITLEQNRQEHPDWPQMLVFGAMFMFNVAAVKADRALDTAYSSKSVDEDMRRPATCAEIAARLQIPYSTVRRQIEAGLVSGRYVRKGRGYISPNSFIASPLVLAGGVQNVRYLLKLLRRLLSSKQKVLIGAES